MWEGGRECTVEVQAIVNHRRSVRRQETRNLEYPKPIQLAFPKVTGPVPMSRTPAGGLAPTPASEPVRFIIKTIKESCHGFFLDGPEHATIKRDGPDSRLRK